MGKKGTQKQAVAYSMATGEEMARMDISNFRLYVHYKYMWAGDLTGEDIDKHRMLFRVEDNPETKTLEEIFQYVAKNSQKHVLTEEEVAAAVTSDTHKPSAAVIATLRGIFWRNCEAAVERKIKRRTDGLPHGRH